MKQLLLLSSCFLVLMLTSCKIMPVTPTRVTDVQFGKIDILRGTVVMNMGLEINNPNKFAITVHGLELDVKVNSVSLGTVNVEDKIKIEKDTQQVYRVNVNAKLTDVINGIPTLLAAIAAKQSNTEVNGFIQIGAFGLKRKFPVAIKQEAVSTSQQ
jgi:LEA14-like dessication related protein